MNVVNEYECPRCHRRAPWTDGTSIEAGDEQDEFWCQTCGAETPLEALEPVTALDSLLDVARGTGVARDGAPT